MKYLQNLHTHTTYCDGKNKAEDIVKRAIELGFTGLGFSGHAPMPYHIPSEYAMSKQNIEEYKKEILTLRKKYKQSLDIFLGIEVDKFSEVSLSGFDYVIGSVHYLKLGDTLIDFDIDARGVKKIINEFYGGNGLLFAKAYYEELSGLPDRFIPDIVGHFDIVAKHCERVPLFDTECEEYRSYALEALHTIAPKCPMYEVNVGGIPRGYRLTPYPQRFILEEMKTLGLKLVISSDCHNLSYLNYGFDEAITLIRDCGFSEVYELTPDGFKGIKI